MMIRVDIKKKKMQHKKFGAIGCISCSLILSNYIINNISPNSSTIYHTDFVSKQNHLINYGIILKLLQNRIAYRSIRKHFCKPATIM